MNKLLSQNFGTITPPQTALSGQQPGQAIGGIIQLVIGIMMAGAGIYAVLNFIVAGYEFMSAGDDSKKVASAWAKIWQTVLGLAVAAGALVLAAIFGTILFGSPTALLNPQITPIH